MKRFTRDEDEFLKSNFLTMTYTGIAEKLNRDVSSVYGRAKVLGLKLPKNIKHERKRIPPKNPGGQFKKGITPWNKGKKMPPSAVEKMKKTWFKKGNLPHNTREDGAISVRYHKRDQRNYLYIRLGKGKWELYHRCVWQQHKGEIPDGMVVAFKDMKFWNCDINNLELITRQELMRRNSWLNYPDELKLAIKQINKLLKMTVV